MLHALKPANAEKEVLDVAGNKLTHLLENPIAPWALLGVLIVSGIWISVLRAKAGSAVPWKSRALWQSIAVSAIAVAAAWVISDNLGSSVPVFGALTALLTVQVALRGSWKLAIQILAGTASALLVAEILTAILGSSIISITCTVLICLIIGRALDLGEDQGVWVATTAMFAASLGTALDESTAADRVLTVIVGAVVGIALSALAHPTSPLIKETAQEMEELALDVSEVFKQLSLLPESSNPVGDATRILAESRELSKKVQRVKETLEKAESTAGAIAGDGKKAVEQLRGKFTVLAMTAEQANTTSRAIFDAYAAGLNFPQSVHKSLKAASSTVKAFPSGEFLTQELEKVDVARRVAARDARELESTTAMLISASVLTDVDRLAEEVRGTALALDLDSADEQIRKSHLESTQDEKLKPISHWFRK